MDKNGSFDTEGIRSVKNAGQPGFFISKPKTQGGVLMKNTVKMRSASKIGIVSLITAIILSGAVLFITGCPTEGSASSGTAKVGEFIQITLPDTDAPVQDENLNTTQYTGTVHWETTDETFKAGVEYTATITINPKSGYTLSGIGRDYFKVNGQASDYSNGKISVVFTTGGGIYGPTVISPIIIQIPVAPNASKPTDLGNNMPGFTGAINWTGGNDGVFAPGQTYAAEIVLTAKSGFTFTGLQGEFRIVNGSVTSQTATTGRTYTLNVQISVSSGTESYKIAVQYNDEPVANNGSVTIPPGGGQITVINTGIQETGALSVSLDPSGIIQPINISSISVGDNRAVAITPVSGLANGTYNVKLTISRANMASVNLNVKIRASGTKYIISQNEALSFTVKKGASFAAGADVTNGTGSIDAVIAAIKADIGANAVLIYFGDETKSEVLDLGLSSITFDGNWGNVELDGKLVSKNADAARGVIYVDGVSLNSYADIESTGDGNASVIFNNNDAPKTLGIDGGIITAKFGRGITNNKTGTVNVTGGTVFAYVKEAIANNSTGNVNVVAGSVQTQEGRAINNKIGTVTVKGGTVSATVVQGVAIYNDGTGTDAGKIIVEDGTVTSINNIPTLGTIVLSSYTYTPGEDGVPVNTLLEVKGGEVKNENIKGKAVYNDTTGRILITSGKVNALRDNALAIYNNKKGPLDISGGEVKVSDGVAITNVSNGLITIDGGVVEALTGKAIWDTWNSAKGLENINVTTITVKGNGLVTSGNPLEDEATVLLIGTGVNDTGSGDALREYIGFEISGNAVVKNTSSKGNAIVNNTYDNVYVKGGTVSAIGGIAIDNRAEIGNVDPNTNGNAKLVISGGTVTVSDGIAVYNRSARGTSKSSAVRTENVTVTNGTVSADTGIAIYNLMDGLIGIKGGLVTSKNTKSDQGTILLAVADIGVPTAPTRLSVTGGVVSNTASTTLLGSGNAIYNASIGRVVIEGNDADYSNPDAPVAESRPDVFVTGSGAAVFVNGSAQTIIRNGSKVHGETGYAVFNKSANNTALVAPYNRYSPNTVSLVIDDVQRDTAMSDTDYEGTTTKVYVTSGSAVYTEAGNVLINGGLVSVDETGFAVNKVGVGIVNIKTTGTDTRTRTTIRAKAATGVAINSTMTAVGGSVNVASDTNAQRILADVLITGNPLVTSKNKTLNQGTIVIANNGGNVYRLTVQGGTIENNGGGVAIFNRSQGLVYVGGTTNTPVTVVSNNASSDEGTIVLEKLAGITSSSVVLFVDVGNVYNSAAGGNAIFSASIAKAQIGTLSTANGSAGRTVALNEAGAYTGGIWVHVDKSDANAIKNVDVGVVDICSGTIEATGARNVAVYNAAGGQINVRGTARPNAIYGTSTTATRVAVTNIDSYAVWNNAGSGVSSSVYIYGGLVEGTSTSTVYNDKTGLITIGHASTPTASASNPVVQSTVGSAVMNNGEGTIAIVGGLIKGDEQAGVTKKGIAVYNASYGKINIATNSTGLKITSVNTNTAEGTIYMGSTSGDKKPELNISSTSGAVIENLGVEGNAVFNASHGYIRIYPAAPGSLTGSWSGNVGKSKRGLGANATEAARGYAIKNINDSAKEFIIIGDAGKGAALNNADVGKSKGTGYTAIDE